MGLFTKAGLWIARGLGLSDPRLYGYFGGEPTDAGESVTVDSAMQIDTVWACVRRIAQTIASLPLHLYRAEEEGATRAVARNHPLYRILHDQPNADMTAVEFWEAMIGCKLLWGNAYARITRGGGRVITALDPMRPDHVSIHYQADGSLSYRYTWPGAPVEEMTEDEVFHIKGFSLDGRVGLSPVAQARNSLASVRAAERVSGSIFRNGMRPSGFLKAPNYLTPQQREGSRLYLEAFTGAQNTGKIPLLEGGWTFEKLSIPPEDAQLLETRSFHVEQICRWFDIPPVLIGHNGQTTWGSGIEQLILFWFKTGLLTQLERVEQAITRSLLRADEKTTLYAEFNVEGLLRADSAGRAEMYSKFAQNGIMSRNEIRGKENLPPVAGGDDITVQSNLIPVNLLGVIAQQPRERIVQPDSAIVKSEDGVSEIPTHTAPPTRQ